MALSLNQTKFLKRVKPGMKVASLGYPDIVAPEWLIKTMLGKKLPELTYREDSKAICKRHGLKDHPIPDAESLFGVLGCELHVYDVVKERGTERLCDLNVPGNLDYAAGFYDVVFDVGTAEHCFNIATAMQNMAGLVKVGGYIVHENPFNWGNHGFYNLNPTFFYDFYLENGFKVEECTLVTRSDTQYVAPPSIRFQFVRGEANVFCIAKRAEVKAFKHPVQSKYRDLILDVGVSDDRAAA
jgi:hypothetical protein